MDVKQLSGPKTGPEPHDLLSTMKTLKEYKLRKNTRGKTPFRYLGKRKKHMVGERDME